MSDLSDILRTVSNLDSPPTETMLYENSALTAIIAPTSPESKLPISYPTHPHPHLVVADLVVKILLVHAQLQENADLTLPPSRFPVHERTAFFLDRLEAIGD